MATIATTYDTARRAYLMAEREYRNTRADLRPHLERRLADLRARMEATRAVTPADVVAYADAQEVA